MRKITKEQVERMGGRELVALHNELCPEKPVKRFASRAAGVRRVLAALEAIEAGEQAEDTAGEQQAAPAGPEQAAPVEAGSGPEEPAQPQPGAGPEQPAPKRSRRRSGVRRFEPGGELKPPRPTSKRGKLLEWLREPQGMAADEIAAMFEWQPRDVMDALRLLAKANGYVVYLGEDERWHAAEPEEE